MQTHLAQTVNDALRAFRPPGTARMNHNLMPAQHVPDGLLSTWKPLLRSRVNEGVIPIKTDDQDSPR